MLHNSRQVLNELASEQVVVKDEFWQANDLGARIFLFLSLFLLDSCFCRFVSEAALPDLCVSKLTLLLDEPGNCHSKLIRDTVVRQIEHGNRIVLLNAITEMLQCLLAEVTVVDD